MTDDETCKTLCQFPLPIKKIYINKLFSFPPQDTLSHSGTGAWPLALRLVASLPLQKWRGLELGAPDENFGLEEGGEKVYNSWDVRTVHSLVTHQTGAHRSAPALMKEALTALFFLRVLQLRGYCSPSSSPGTLSPEELETALLLHHFMRVVFYNSHEASALVSTPQNEKKVSKIGVTINPSLALINHRLGFLILASESQIPPTSSSCDPNYGRVARGSKVLGFATLAMKKVSDLKDCEGRSSLSSLWDQIK